MSVKYYCAWLKSSDYTASNLVIHNRVCDYIKRLQWCKTDAMERSRWPETAWFSNLSLLKIAYLSLVSYRGDLLWEVQHDWKPNVASSMSTDVCYSVRPAHQIDFRAVLHCDKITPDFRSCTLQYLNRIYEQSMDFLWCLETKYQKNTLLHALCRILAVLPHSQNLQSRAMVFCATGSVVRHLAGFVESIIYWIFPVSREGVQLLCFHTNRFRGRWILLDISCCLYVISVT